MTMKTIPKVAAAGVVVALIMAIGSPMTTAI